MISGLVMLALSGLVRPTIPHYNQILVKGFPEDSDAVKIVNYRYSESKGDLDMIYTFIMENGAFDKDKISATNDYGICQLHYNKTNKKRINDPRRDNIYWQAKICLEKWKVVRDKYLWRTYPIRYKAKDRLIFD